MEHKNLDDMSLEELMATANFGEKQEEERNRVITLGRQARAKLNELLGKEINGEAKSDYKVFKHCEGYLDAVRNKKAVPDEDVVILVAYLKQGDIPMEQRIDYRKIEKAVKDLGGESMRISTMCLGHKGWIDTSAKTYRDSFAEIPSTTELVRKALLAVDKIVNMKTGMVMRSRLNREGGQHIVINRFG